MYASPLARLHSARGAQLTAFAGWDLPLRFRSDLAEHQAVRTAAGLFDLSHMAQLWVTGTAAGVGLDQALAGSHSQMVLGRASYSLILATDGGIIDDLIVYRLGEAEFLIIANAANRETVATELATRLAQLNVTLQDRTFERSLIAVQGPAAATIMAALGLGQVISDLRYYTIGRANLVLADQPIEILLARTGYTGEDGFELSVAASAAESLWLALEAAGTDQGLTLAGLACRDSLRLEAGMSLYGHELTRQTTPIEAGLKRFVDLDKGDFVGRSALIDRPPSQSLVALAGTGRRAARAGYPVLVGGQVTGQVTSGVLSPTLGYPIALAYVNGPKLAPGTQVEVDVRGTAQPYTVVGLPFYRRPK